MDQGDGIRNEVEFEDNLGQGFYFGNFVKQNTKRGILFANVLVAALIILQTMTVTILKRVSCNMANYPYTLTQMQPVGTTIVFTTLYLITRKMGDSTTGYSPIEVKPPFPVSNNKKYKLAIIGGLFTLSNFALFSGSRGEYLSGPLITLFHQVVVPCTIFLSIILLRRRFSIPHYLGAMIIIAGIMFTIWPKLDDKEKEKNNHWWAAVLIMVSTFFQASAIVYMEKNLKYNDMPFLSSWAWINVFELLLTIPLAVAIPPVQGISFREIPKNVLYGYECFFTNENHPMHESCHYIGVWFILFIVVLVLNKLLMTYVIKEGSSSLAMVSLTCALPLSNFAFTSKHIVGSCSEVNLYWRDFVGLAIVVFGLIVYRYTMFIPLFNRRQINRTTVNT